MSGVKAALRSVFGTKPSVPGRDRSNAVSSGVVLNVPLVAQDKSNTCWYAAACMVSYYFAAGPRLGVPSVWALGDQRGILPAEFVKLARNEGLTNQPLLTYHAGAQLMYPPSVLRQMLKDHGPIWCAGFWYGPGHVIVLTGSTGNTIFFNDPDGGVKKVETADWFNQKIARTVPGHMLCKVPGAS